LTLILQALRSIAPQDRDEVILPAYTCYSVAASIVKAGLRPRTVDVDPASLDLSAKALERIDTNRVLAVVATSLYGLPGDVASLEQFARDRGIYLVDDAAQSMGATFAGRPCGTFGDVGLFSFDKGKALAAIDGGVAVTNSDEVAKALAAQFSRLPAPAVRTHIQDLLKLAMYSAFLRPWLYGIPNGIPALKLGVTQYRTDFALTSESSLLAALALVMLRRLDEFTAARIENATRLTAALGDVSGVRAIRVHPRAQPSFVRYPVLVDDASVRRRLLDRLTRAGIGATGSYPGSIADIPDLRGVFPAMPDASGARYVADRILTLPTHPYVGSHDTTVIADIIRAGAAGAAAAPVPRLAVR
jgi:dTDP-4-amino-4,6-dideoxygalactose transaminase